MQLVDRFFAAPVLRKRNSCVGRWLFQFSGRAGRRAEPFCSKEAMCVKKREDAQRKKAGERFVSCEELAVSRRQACSYPASSV